jgi:hypothetical protein
MDVSKDWSSYAISPNKLSPRSGRSNEASGDGRPPGEEESCQEEVVVLSEALRREQLRMGTDRP